MHILVGYNFLRKICGLQINYQPISSFNNYYIIICSFIIHILTNVFYSNLSTLIDGFLVFSQRK